jgi:hypothetical protein
MEENDFIDFTVVEEGRSESSWMQESPVLRVPFPDGSYLARATLGGLASAPTPFTLGEVGEVPVVTLVLLPRASFTVRFVDQHGAPLQVMMIMVDPGSAANPAAPQRVDASCVNGTCEFEGLTPGTYDVHFAVGAGPPFMRRLELKPGGEPVVVTVP